MNKLNKLNRMGSESRQEKLFCKNNSAGITLQHLQQQQ